MALTVADLRGKLVGVCVSGGLDSKTVSKRLVEDGCKVLAFSADLGQPDEDDIQNVRRRMATCGVETIIVDLKAEMAEGCFEVLQAQARYDGGYWNTTGIGRIVTCHGLIKAMTEHKVEVLSHGATGRGNDQMRFERYTNVLAPKMRVYAPWRDPALLKVGAHRRAPSSPGSNLLVTGLCLRLLVCISQPPRAVIAFSPRCT
jgi:argininosuccinate synthase